MKPNAIAGAAGALVFLLLAGIGLRNDYPPLPDTLRLGVTFAAAQPGQADPILVSGATGIGDFVYLRHLSADTAVVGYDCWGRGGPVSQPCRVQNGRRHEVVVTAPMLGRQPSPRLRVIWDGVTVLDQDVLFHAHNRNEVFLGSNPIGGTSCGPELAARLDRGGGAEWRGGPDRLFSWRERIASWGADSQWRLWPLLGLSTLGALAGLRWGQRKRIARAPRPGRWRRAAREHGCFVAVAAVCLLAFGYSVTGSSFQFNYPEDFGAFYDFQARSLLHGQLDVPPDAIGGEAFVIAGKYYGYFGITPAVMRIPFVVLDVMVNQLSRGFMIFDYGWCLIAAYLLLRQVARILHPRDPRLSPWAVALFIANVGLGSTLFFLSSRSYVYHEAILCAAAFGLVSAWFTLRYVAEPAGRGWLGALLTGLLCIQTRPSTGLFALLLLGAAAAVNLYRRGRTPRDLAGAIPARRLAGPLWVGLGCILAILSFNGMSYLKFGSFGGSPFKYHIQFDAARLGRMGGRNFHLANLPFNFAAYLTRPTFQLKPAFPFVFYTGLDSTGRGGVVNGVLFLPDAGFAADRAIRMDVTEPTLGLPFAMTGLALLSVAGTVYGAVRRRELGWFLLAAWAAVIPFTLAMFMAISLSHRYTADFCPFLIAVGAIGLAALEQARGRAIARAVLAAATGWSIFVTLALTLHYQGVETWGVPETARQNYQMLAQTVDSWFGLKPPTP